MILKKMRLSLIFIIFLQCIQLNAQQERKLIRKGNEHFEMGEFGKAKSLYLDAISRNPESKIAPFNLGGALYKENKFDEAAGQYESIANVSDDSAIKAAAYHNLGNAYLSLNKLQESIEAYKKSLRINPEREDTRYNLVWAMEKLKSQQKNQNQQQQQQQQKNESEEKENTDKPQEQPPGLTKEQAERMLEAMQNREKEIQEKLQKDKPKSPAQIDKDW